MSRLDEIDARVAFLRDSYAAGEVTDMGALEEEVRSLAVERTALLGDTQPEAEEYEPDEGVGEALPVSRGGLSVAERVDALVDFAAAICVAWHRLRATVRR